MATRKATTRLYVYLNGLPLGTLESKSRKSLRFTYKQEWLERKASFPISRSLPLQEEAYESDWVYAYFDNLLPDRDSIRQRIAARMQARSDQVFDLLAVIGKDCIGALQFVKEEDPPLMAKVSGIPISDAELATKLKNLRTIPLAVSVEDDIRLSIAGAQEKTAFLLLDKKWHIPLGATPTTHIFKPEIGELRPGLNFSNSVENEWICTKIAGEFGLSVANCDVARFEDKKALIVKRFDRAWSEKKLIRIPQEDMCQALGIPNFIKYENDGGPGIVSIMDLLFESRNPEKDRSNFFKSQIVFYLLAAIDGHAKNYSIRWGPEGFSMTPFYDILSAQPMIDKGELSGQKVRMAMAFGNNKHYKIKDIHKRHFLQTAKSCRFDIDQAEAIIHQTLADVDPVIHRVSTMLYPDFPEDVANSIFMGMKERAKRMK